MAGVREVRIHGVSGTPPRAMLRTDPIVTEASTRRRPEGIVESRLPIRRNDTDLRAYNWSGLTSGKPISASWILLLPFTLLNTAGWMLPRSARGTVNGIAVAAVRIVGLILTAIFTTFAIAITLDLYAVKCKVNGFECLTWTWIPQLSNQWWVVLGLIVPALVAVALSMLVGWRRTMIREAVKADEKVAAVSAAEMHPHSGYAADAEDPARHYRIDEDRMWRPHPLARSLSRLNLAAAMSITAVAAHLVRHGIAVESGEAWVRDGLSTFITVALIPLVIAAAATRSVAPTHGGNSRSYRPLTYVVLVLSVLNLVWLIGEILALDDPPVPPELGGIRLVILALIGGVILASILVLVLAARDAGWLDGAPPTALILMAGLIGAAFGSGIHVLAVRFLTDPDGVGEQILAAFAGMDWIAAAFLIFLIAAGIGGLAVMNEKWSGSSSRSERLMGALTGLTTAMRAYAVFLVVAVFLVALIVAIPNLDNLRTGLDPAFELKWLRLLIGLSAAVFGVLLAVFLFRYFAAPTEAGARGTTGYGIVGVVAVAGLGWALATYNLPTINFFGFELSFGDMQQIATSIAVVVPTGFILSRLVGTFRNAEERRGIAILWDVASFWPNWYHPFSAPYYTAVAVPDLHAYVLETVDDGVHSMVVAAHSQGTVLAAAALLTIPPAAQTASEVVPVWDKVRLLTYGSPLRHLYHRFFPAHFSEEQLARLHGKLGHPVGWINLHRPTDPIGGDAITEAHTNYQADGVGHSGYETTIQYRDAVRYLSHIHEGGETHLPV